MSNPFLPIPFDPDNYGLTVFQPDQVLTASQLNTLFGFLLNEEQRTRTRLLGVGVLCGFGLQSKPDALTVKAGVGVPTGGDLIALETDKVLTHVRPYTSPASYVPFAGLQLWEATVDEPTARVRPQPITSLSLTDKVVLLFLESALETADECTGVACDNKGDAFTNRLRILLVQKADAVRLIADELRQQANAPWQLPVLTMPRVGLNELPYNASLVRFQAFIDRTVKAFSAGFQQAYAVVNKVAGIQDPVSSLKKLAQVAKDNSVGSRIQYVYDWLHDLYDAYETFRQDTQYWLVECLPDADAFPKHLVLGELTVPPNQPRPAFRHPWLRSPGVAGSPDARQRAIWAYNRILRLLESFSVPSAISDSFGIAGRGTVVTLSTQITPDRWRTAPFDERSMPFYYLPGLRDNWSYPLTQRGQTNRLLSFHSPEAGSDATLRPFRYAIETYPFYRIEGILGAGVSLVLQTVLSLRQQYNLAFEVVALRADVNQKLMATVPSRVNPRVALGVLPGQLNPGLIGADIATGAGLTVTQPFNPKEANQALIKLTQTARQTLTQFGKTEKVDISLKMPAALLKQNISRLEASAAHVTAQSAEEGAKLQVIIDSMKAVAAEAAQQPPTPVVDPLLTFGPFLQAHPGIDHGAGVPRGGTFILVYKDNDAKGSTGQSIVVADFYLPYIVGGSGPVTQFVLPAPPPFIWIDKQNFTVDESAALVSVSPIGGRLTGGNVRPQDDAFLFTPNAAGTFTLTYTAPDNQTATVTVTVVKPIGLPTAKFDVGQQNRMGTAMVVNLINQSTDATSVHWDFGDGQAEDIELPADKNGDTNHTFVESGTYTIKLTAKNSKGENVFTNPLVIDPPPVPKIDVASILCFDAQRPQQAKGNPEGGTFKSDTIDIKETGEFLPNKEGEHTINYNAPDGQVATTSVFVLPGSINIARENAKFTTDGSTFNFEMIKLPPGVTASWTVNEKLITPKETKDVENGRQRLFFSEKLSLVSTLTLTLKINDQETCQPISTRIPFRQ